MIRPSLEHRPSAPASQGAADRERPAGRVTRREQARSVETRRIILEASLVEFAEKGFEAASTRGIGERAGLHHTLISYHFGCKDGLWRATAEHFFGEIHSRFEAAVPADAGLEPIDQVRRFVRSLWHFSLETPALHHFMVRESSEGGPRLQWLMDTIVPSLRQDMLAAIAAAQADGDLPGGPPALLFYFIVGVVSVPAALGAEIRYGAGLDLKADVVAEQYWTLVEQMVFGRKSFKVPQI